MGRSVNLFYTKSGPAERCLALPAQSAEKKSFILNMLLENPEERTAVKPFDTPAARPGWQVDYRAPP